MERVMLLGFTDIDFSGGDFFVNATYAWDGNSRFIHCCR
jgi:hypothetical protein